MERLPRDGDGPGRGAHRRPELDARSLKVIVYGWAALPPATLASMKQHCGEDLLVFEIFGQTESISCHRFWPDRWPRCTRAPPQQNYVGVPSPVLASTVLDTEGQDLSSSPGTPGEAVYRSPSMMSGYYRDEAATREAFRSGWFHSGDSCVYDDEGLRVMLDRYKDIVKTGGENVSRPGTRHPSPWCSPTPSRRPWAARCSSTGCDPPTPPTTTAPKPSADPSRAWCGWRDPCAPGPGWPGS